MGKVRDGLKERYWRGVIRRQGKSGETVTRFCADEGVRVHQFYWWRRSLRARDGQSTLGSRVAADDQAAGQEEKASPSFVPVRLSFSPQAQTLIEMLHPSGWVVRVPVGFDPLSLRRILATLEPSASSVGEN